MKLSLSVRVAEPPKRKDVLALPFDTLAAEAKACGYAGLSMRASAVSVDSPPERITAARTVLDGLGLAASINAGEAHCMAQAQHGSAPDIAGKDVANPASLVLSAAMLLGWLGERHGERKFLEAQSAVEAAVARLVADPATRTCDLGGALGTKAFGAALAEQLR